MTLAFFGFLAGAVMALRFDFLVLVPAIPIGWMLVLVGGFATALSVGTIIFGMLMVAVALQLGYLSGILLRWGIVAARTSQRGTWAVKPETEADQAF